MIQREEIIFFIVMIYTIIYIIYNHQNSLILHVKSYIMNNMKN